MSDREEDFERLTDISKYLDSYPGVSSYFTTVTKSEEAFEILKKYLPPKDIYNHDPYSQEVSSFKKQLDIIKYRQTFRDWIIPTKRNQGEFNEFYRRMVIYLNAAIRYLPE